jgi:hypothetical protein
MNIPDYISPFVAYRAWHWELDGTVKSLNGTVWTPRVAHVASCRSNLPHTAPDPNCRCGIYAGKHWEHLIGIGYAGYGIHGEVELWGKIEECKLGYRAQYAYPKFFVVPPNMLCLDMVETEQKMKALIDFNVVAADNKTEIGMEKIPLWVKDFGYSAQGIAFIGERIQRMYSYRDEQCFTDPKVDERLAIKGKGIAIVESFSRARKEVVVRLWNQMCCRIPRESVVWNRQNNRWESDTAGIIRVVDYADRTGKVIVLGKSVGR